VDVTSARDEVRDGDVRLGRAWREHRRYVLDIALRMLGDLGAAEDVVQEAFARLHRGDLGAIDDPRAWLVTVVSRLCLDELRSARRRRQDPFDESFEPPPARDVEGSGPGSAASDDPADRITLDDTVRMALQVVLQRLSPAERTAFVLHDVFQLPFEEIAGIVGRSVPACRQLASRARRHVGDDGSPIRFTVETSAERQVTERFITAVSTGDLDGLLAVLDPDVDGQADFGASHGHVVDRHVVGRHVVGRQGVAVGTLGYLGPQAAGITLLTLPTGRRQPTLLVLRDGEVAAVVGLTIRAGLVTHLEVVLDPTQLAPLQATLRGE
jgi:RNA polymerase sigma-70 factor, ECF subfamily